MGDRGEDCVERADRVLLILEMCSGGDKCSLCRGLSVEQCVL
jgi:hypothetical protein